jgi:glycosyltransferase involved in cell wall biosynthesis
MSVRIAIVTNIVPHYRRDFYERIMACDALDCVLFCQRDIPGLTFNTILSELPGQVRELSSVGLSRERLVWQRLPIMYLWRHFDIYVFYGNPRILSTVVWASALRLAGRKVIIWGQGHTAGAPWLRERIRLYWWRLFDYFFVYTDSEASQLKQCGFERKTVVGMNNGLDVSIQQLQIQRWDRGRLEGWRKTHGLQHRLVIVSCARLLEKNRFDVMIQCMPGLISAFNNILWCVIGDGPLASQLKAQAKGVGVDGNILWVGQTYDEDDLAPWFLISECCIHPGAIGLSVLHAFGYGLPVITHDNMRNHMPEIAVLRDGWNGLLYRENDSGALLEKILELLRDGRKRSEMRDNARAVTAKFNTRIMASRFVELVQATGSC